MDIFLSVEFQIFMPCWAGIAVYLVSFLSYGIVTKKKKLHNKKKTMIAKMYIH